MSVSFYAAQHSRRQTFSYSTPLESVTCNLLVSLRDIFNHPLLPPSAWRLCFIISYLRVVIVRFNTLLRDWIVVSCCNISVLFCLTSESPPHFSTALKLLTPCGTFISCSQFHYSVEYLSRLQGTESSKCWKFLIKSSRLLWDQNYHSSQPLRFIVHSILTAYVATSRFNVMLSPTSGSAKLPCLLRLQYFSLW